VGVEVGVRVGVRVGVDVDGCDPVEVGVEVGVRLGVRVGVRVGVWVSTLVGTTVDVGAGVKAQAPRPCVASQRPGAVVHVSSVLEFVPSLRRAAISTPYELSIESQARHSYDNPLTFCLNT
jgi:hypothetical protein